ncbi:MAG: hypothetical protein ABSD70_20730 [Terracidiphilus sp.]|jgi:hypothetical protein
MSRGLIHEAGHAVIGLHFGFDIDGIEMKDRFLSVMITDLDSPERTQQERYIFLTGGIASESLSFGNYDVGAVGDDQKKINVRGGGPVEDYVVDALEILRTNKVRLDQIKNELCLKGITAPLEAGYNDDPDSYVLLSRQELYRIWAGCQGPKIQTGSTRLSET